MEKQSLSYYIKSSIITFITGFGLTILVSVKDLDGDVLEGGVLIGIILAGVRAGIKAFAQFLIPVMNDFSKALINWIFSLLKKKK